MTTETKPKGCDGMLHAENRRCGKPIAKDGSVGGDWLCVEHLAEARKAYRDQGLPVPPIFDVREN